MAVTHHYPHALSTCGKRISTAIAVDVRENHLKGITTQVERRTTSFREPTRTIAKHNSQRTLIVMSRHQVQFAIAIHIGCVSEPRLTGAQGKFAPAKATTSIIQQQRQSKT